MNKNNLKLSILSTAIMLTLAGCGGSSDSTPVAAVDSAPSAKSSTVNGAQQWIPIQGVIDANDANGDALTFSIMEGGEQVVAEKMEFTH